MKRKFIINPRAGAGCGEVEIAAWERFFRDRDGGFDCSVTSSRQEAIQSVRRALREGAQQIVAAGGDGTVNAAVNGFFEHGRPLRTEASLAIADLGTGCDYFRAVAPGRRGLDWKELALDHAIRPVDVGRIRFAAGIDDCYFVNMASAGMSAEVVARKEGAARWLPRRLRYVLPTLLGVFAGRARPVRVTAGDQEFEGQVLGVTVCKGTHAGGGIPFGGRVALDDGLFDITIFLGTGRFGRLAKLAKLYRGTLKNDPVVRPWKADRISIRSPEAVPVEFDGELHGTTDLEIALEPRALRLCVPR